MKKIIVMMSVLYITGCSNPITEQLARAYIPSEIVKTPKNPEHLYFAEDGQIDLEKLYQKPPNTPDETKAFIATAIAMSDKKCNIHKAIIISNANTWNIGSGAAAILFSGAASIVSNAQRAAQLAASASATSGIQSLVNKEVYANALGTTILRAIDVGREKKKAVLENGMNNDNYGFNIALVDLMAYHDSCSMMAGLIEVTKSLDNRKQSRNEIDRDLKFINEQLTGISNLSGLGNNEKNQLTTTLTNELNLKLIERVKSSID